MPLYEYICTLCHKPFTVLIGVTAASDSSACPHCGSLKAIRRVSRFGRLRSEDHILDKWTSGDQHGDRSDNASPRQWAGDLSDALGEDLGADFEEYLDASDEDHAA